MAWPYDARLENAVSGQPADPATRNAMQDRIVDLHRRQYAWLQNGLPNVTGGAPDWNYAVFAFGATLVHAWQCQAVGALYFPLDGLRTRANGARVYAVRIKVHNAAGGAGASITAGLDFQNAKLSDPLVAPLAVLTDGTDAAAGAANTYDVLVLTPAAPPVLLAADVSAIVWVATPTIGDSVIAVEVDYEPLTATP